MWKQHIPIVGVKQPEAGPRADLSFGMVGGHRAYTVFSGP